MRTTILKILFTVLLIGQISATYAYQINASDYSLDGNFSYPIAVKQGDETYKYENYETVEYIYTKMAFINSVKSMIGNYKEEPLERAKYLYITSVLSDFEQDAKVPISRHWPILAGQLTAALDGTEWPPKDETEVIPENSKNGFNFNGTKLRTNFGDWRKSASESKGATFSILDDKESNAKTLNSQGALILPFAKTLDVLRDYQETVRLLYIQWNIKDVSSGDDSDIEELKLGYGVSRLKDFPEKSVLLSLEYGANAYYLTDFDLEGELVGIDLTTKPAFDFFGLTVGTSQALYKGSVMSSLLEVEPKLSYSKVLTGSPFINREEDDINFSVGVSVSFTIQPFGYAKERKLTNNWGLEVSYQYLNDLTDENQETTDLFTAGLFYGLSDRTSLKIKYQNGETESTNKPIDQVMIGLEVKL